MSWIGWAILSAIFAAATALLAKVGVAHVDSNLAMALRTSVVVVFAWAIVFAVARSEIAATGATGFAHGVVAELRSLDRRTLLFLTLSGLATGLSWLCYFRALQLGPASRVAPIDKLSVPLVILFAGSSSAKSSPLQPSSAASSSPPEPSSSQWADRIQFGSKFSQEARTLHLRKVLPEGMCENSPRWSVAQICVRRRAKSSRIIWGSEYTTSRWKGSRSSRGVISAYNWAPREAPAFRTAREFKFVPEASRVVDVAEKISNTGC
jgi:transporter family protein